MQRPWGGNELGISGNRKKLSVGGLHELRGGWEQMRSERQEAQQGDLDFVSRPPSFSLQTILSISHCISHNESRQNLVHFSSLEPLCHGCSHLQILASAWSALSRPPLFKKYLITYIYLFTWLLHVLVMSRGLSCSEAYGILFPRLGIEPVSTALEDEFLNTGPTGSPSLPLLLADSYCPLKLQ